MTDNEIIKALECCIKAETWGDCEEMGCPASTKQGCYFYLRTDDDYENTIYIEILKDVLDLINRQKAEIERYKEYYETMEAELDSFRKDQAEVKFLKNRIRAEEINEFAGRVKQLNNSSLIIWNEQIDNLVKEMTEERGNDR